MRKVTTNATYLILYPADFPTLWKYFHGNVALILVWAFVWQNFMHENQRKRHMGDCTCVQQRQTRKKYFGHSEVKLGKFS